MDTKVKRFCNFFRAHDLFDLGFFHTSEDFTGKGVQFKTAIENIDQLKTDGIENRKATVEKSPFISTYAEPERMIVDDQQRVIFHASDDS